MTNNTNPISVTYSDDRLRTLVEEYITMQKHEFTFSGLCSYVLYWAREEGKTANTGLYESNDLVSSDCERLNIVLQKIKGEGRITVDPNDDARFLKTKE